MFLLIVLSIKMFFIRLFGKNICGDKMKRIIFVFCSILLCFSVAVLRIAYIINSDFMTAGVDHSRKTVEIGKIRGTIFAQNGVRLTNTEYEYFVAIEPNSPAIAEVSQYLDETDRKTLLSGFPVSVKVDEDFYSDSVRKLKIPKRYGKTAPHIIGYCDENGDGICGIEQSFNSYLKGETVSVSFDTNSKGEIIGDTSEIEDYSENSCEGVMLTLDKSMQNICEEVARENMQKGAIVVLENKSGKIRAMVSYPDYDQNDVASSLDSPDSPFYNRAIAPYNCGSVFKLCVAAASLYYDVSLTYDCKGEAQVGDTKFGCLSAHKKVNLKKALALSCNCYFIKLGQLIGAKNLLSFAKSMGFGNEITLSSNIVSTGAKLPDKTDLLQKGAELANFSFGQGVIMTSPLQVGSMIQCIANNGKLIKPSLVEGTTNSEGKIIQPSKRNLPTYILNKEDAKTLKEYMIYTVKEGTGKPAKPQFSGAGGKTATAQTGIFDKDGNSVYQTWFGGFYPAKNPVYTIVVMCEDGESGSKTAAPIFKKIADKIYGI